MLENAPNQQDSDPGEYDPLRQALLRPILHQLAKQGLYSSPEEALKLFEQKLIYDIKRDIQQDLAEQGIHVSPDEADAIDKLQFYHQLMKRTGITDPHDAIVRMASDDSPKPYEPYEPNE